MNWVVPTQVFAEEEGASLRKPFVKYEICLVFSGVHPAEEIQADSSTSDWHTVTLQRTLLLNVIEELIPAPGLALMPSFYSEKDNVGHLNSTKDCHHTGAVHTHRHLHSTVGVGGGVGTGGGALQGPDEL